MKAKAKILYEEDSATEGGVFITELWRITFDDNALFVIMQHEMATDCDKCWSSDRILPGNISTTAEAQRWAIAEHDRNYRMRAGSRR